MCLQTTIYQVPGCTNNPRTGTNGQYKSGKSAQLENSNKHHRGPQIPRVHRLLSLFHQRLLKNHQTIITTNAFANPLVVESRGTSIARNITNSHDQQTGTMTTRLHQTILCSHRHLGVWHGSHTLTGRRIRQSETQTTPCRLLLSHLH
jgi:hypothetical protein